MLDMLRYVSEISETGTPSTANQVIQEKNETPPDCPLQSLRLSLDANKKERSCLSTLSGYRLPRLQLNHVYFVAIIIMGLVTNISFLIVNGIDPGAGPLLTTLQYTFTLLVTPPRAFLHRKIPLEYHAGVVLFVFLAAFLGNRSLEWSLPVPIFFLIKNGNLVAAMLIGKVVLGRKYVPRQMFAVLLISLGICWVTAPNETNQETTRKLEMFVGIFLLVLALIANAMFGAIQEIAFKSFGKHTDELVFSQHLFVLPLLVTGAPEAIRTHAATLITHQTLWIFVASNVLSNHLCKVVILRLLQRTSSLHVQYASTSFRFLSVLISQMFLSPEAGGAGQRHFWVGTAIVLVGTLINVHTHVPESGNKQMHRDSAASK